MPGVSILVFVEGSGGKLKKPSLEALGEGRRMASSSGGTVSAVLLGREVRAMAAEIRGASSVFLLEDELLECFHLHEAANAVVASARRCQADVVLLASTATGRELAGAVAADLATCVASDVTELRLEGISLTVKRPVYAGKAFLTARFRKFPAVVTLRPNVFAQESGGAAPGSIEDLPGREGAPRTSVVQGVEPPSVKQDLAEADTIVSGGRGLKAPENFSILESLARQLGGVVGASRAVCDLGWRPHCDQVGQTGKTVSPRLYIACGISGAIQHLAGMSSSKTIVAINKDPSAPIFAAADYGIVGDLFEVVPALEAEIRRNQ